MAIKSAYRPGDGPGPKSRIPERAFLLYQQGTPVAELGIKYGVSRQWMYTWIGKRLTE